MEDEKGKGDIAPVSKKKTLLERLSGRYPDDNLEDEELLFGRLGELDEENGRLRDVNEQVNSVLENDPRIGRMLAMAKKSSDDEDESIFNEWLLSTFGDDLVALQNDPESLKNGGGSSKRRAQEEIDRAKAIEDSVTNAMASIDKIMEYANGEGIEEDVAKEAIGRLLDKYNRIREGHIDLEMFQEEMKSTTYDDAVSEAAKSGELKARNDKIITGRKTFEDVAPNPSVSSESGIDRALKAGKKSFWD